MFGLFHVASLILEDLFLANNLVSFPDVLCLTVSFSASGLCFFGF